VPKTFLDASVLIAAALTDCPEHAGALAAVRAGGVARTHCLAEAFAQLTGKYQVPADAAVAALSSFTDQVRWVSLSPAETWTALKAAQAAGVRGGGVYDWLHITAARAHGCTRWATYNGRHFKPHAKDQEEVWSP